jgi:hypothetical protein
MHVVATGGARGLAGAMPPTSHQTCFYVIDNLIIYIRKI